MNRRGGLALAGFLFGLAWLFLAGPAHAAGRAECNSVPSKILRRAVPYCVLLPPSYDADKARRYPVLYFLHGIGENEQALLNSGGWDLIQDLWDQKQMGEFVIAAPAGGRTFFINSRDGKVRYQDFLMREFLPYIESHYRIRAGRHSRGIAGISMGGYGALRLGLLFPQTFAAVSANSPALMPSCRTSRWRRPVTRIFLRACWDRLSECRLTARSGSVRIRSRSCATGRGPLD